MTVTSPSVNRITAGSNPGFRDSLAESAIRNTTMRSQLDNNARALQLHQKHGKWNVLIPSRLFEQPFGMSKEPLRFQSVEALIHFLTRGSGGQSTFGPSGFQLQSTHILPRYELHVQH